jgi:hypothetical protein
MTVTSTQQRTFSRRDVAALQKESPPFFGRERTSKAQKHRMSSATREPLDTV